LPNPNRNSSALPARLHFVDACRALAVLGMLFANMMNVFLQGVPDVLSHNREGDSLRAFDFPAPTFQFLVGVSLVLFLERRRAARGGGTTPTLLALFRFALLLVLGIVLDDFGAYQAWPPRWGVLQTLALGGAAATALAAFPDTLVATVALALLALFSGAANGEVHAHVLSAFAFVPLTLAGLLIGRGLVGGQARRGFVGRALLVALAGMAFAAIGHAAGIPFNKVAGTSSFVALAGAVAALLLLATAALEASGMVFPGWLLALGSNALMAWVLQYALVYYPAWLVFPEWNRLPLVTGLVVAFAALVALSALTIRLGRRGIRIPI
jgi:heparan-alpha-glucosaminide N-acetyltransferase-like protein